jgi:hypothetical protein
MNFEHSLYTWFLISVQVFGFTTAILARFCAGSKREASCHTLFFAGLTLVGLSAMTQLTLRTASCAMSSAVFAAMVLVATCDFSSEPQRVAE